MTMTTMMMEVVIIIVVVVTEVAVAIMMIKKVDNVCLIVFGATVPSGPGPLHSRGF
jgi:hypothetical protein